MLFLPNAQPLLLLVDGYITHYQLELIKRAKGNALLILCLPLHTTLATQPLDCGVFSPLKSQWSATCHEFFKETYAGKVITKFRLCRRLHASQIRMERNITIRTALFNLVQIYSYMHMCTCTGCK